MKRIPIGLTGSNVKLTDMRERSNKGCLPSKSSSGSKGMACPGILSQTPSTQFIPLFDRDTVGNTNKSGIPLPAPASETQDLVRYRMSLLISHIINELLRYTLQPFQHGQHCEHRNTTCDHKYSPCHPNRNRLIKYGTDHQ